MKKTFSQTLIIVSRNGIIGGLIWGLMSDFSSGFILGFISILGFLGVGISYYFGLLIKFVGLLVATFLIAKNLNKKRIDNASLISLFSLASLCFLEVSAPIFTTSQIIVGPLAFFIAYNIYNIIFNFLSLGKISKIIIAVVALSVIFIVMKFYFTFLPLKSLLLL